jgi:branched-chain amino acid transport system substrate-binding protein
MNKGIWAGLGVVVLVCELIFVASNKEAEIVKIGWIGPQTGPSAVLGMDSYVAARIAVDEINSAGGLNGKKVELYAEDDQYDNTKALSAYRKLVNVDGVRLILVNTYSSVFSLAKQAEKDGVILMDPLDCNSELAKLSPNVFCLATDSESLARVLAAAADARGYKKVGVLYFNSDLFMPLVQKVFVGNYKGTVVLSDSYVAGTQDFRTQIAKAINAGADALVLLGYDETGNAMKQARELGFNGQFLTTGTVTSPPLQEAAQGAADGTLFAFWSADKSSAKIKIFDAEFNKRQNRSPILDLATYPTYDATKILVAAAARGVSATSVAKQLALTQYDGLVGKVSFSTDGAMLVPEGLYLLKGKKILPQ